MDPLTLALIAALAGGGIGALTNLNDPHQMWKNAGIGASIGGLAGTGVGMAAPSLLGTAPQAIQLGASTVPGYSLSGASQMPSMSASFAGLPSIAGDTALMGVNPLMASASGGTIASAASGGIPVESLMKIMQFGSNPTGQSQQQPQPAMQPQPGQRPNVQLLQRILEEEQNKRRRMPGFSQDLFRLMGG